MAAEAAEDRCDLLLLFEVLEVLNPIMDEQGGIGASFLKRRFHIILSDEVSVWLAVANAIANMRPMVDSCLQNIAVNPC